MPAEDYLSEVSSGDLLATSPCPNSILVYVGHDLIGDGLLKLPFLRSLRQTWPTARVTWLAGTGRSAFAGPLAPMAGGLIDEVIENAGVGIRVSELFGQKPLAGQRFDLVIDTQLRLLTTMILRRIDCEVFVSGAGNFLFSDCKPIKRLSKSMSMHDQLLQLLHVTSGSSIELSPAPLFGDYERELAAFLLPAGSVYIGLVPGAGGRHKCWPRQSYIDLAARLGEQGYRPVVILGPGEYEWEAEFRGALPGAHFPLQEAAAMGKEPSTKLTAALAGRLNAAVANDSGGGHLLAAGGVPLVLIWGTTNFAKWAPQTSRILPIFSGQFGSSIADIPVGVVEGAVEAILTNSTDTASAASLNAR